MNEDFKGLYNIFMANRLVSDYGNIDGLSLQNLYVARNGKFPGCYLFECDPHGNVDYKFDTKKMMKYLIENADEDENVEIVPYITKVLGSKKNETHLGFCIIFNKSRLWARFEPHVSDSYILFDNDNIDKLNEFVESILQFYVAPDEKQNTIWRICASNGGYYLEDGTIKIQDNFDVGKLYNDDFAKEDEKICKFMEKEDKSGLVMLHGKRGTGKSTYIKHLVNKYPDRKFVYVPAALVPLLGDPAFGSFLTTLANHVIVLEDCENAIANRKSTNSAAAVSLLLNMTDGLLSDDLGMKFICTFNEDTKSIDEALLRKGRLVSKYEFKELNLEKTNALLNEIGVEEISKNPLTLADIFHYEEEGYEVEKKSII